MNRIKYCFAAVALTIFMVGAQPPSEPESMSDKTALEFLREVKIGWNLGNTMDAVRVTAGVPTATEGAWAPVATQALLNGVVESGFDVIRIPVTWMGHIGDAPDYIVSEARLARVAEIIGYAKSAGAKAIIINIHHDGHGNDHQSWLRMSNVIPSGTSTTINTEVMDELTDKLYKVWTQIAEYFKNYGDYLIFETLNEVHGGGWGDNLTAASFPYELDVLLEWKQASLDAIRATGGNNAIRYVAIPGLGGTEPRSVETAHARGKLIPNDSEENGTDRLIVKAHYYTPKSYTVNPAAENPRLTWGAETDVNELNTNVNRMVTQFINNGIAVYIGECGGRTARSVNIQGNITEQVQADHINYMSSVARAWRTNDIIPVFWDDGGNFKLLERSNGKPIAGGFAERVVNAMMEAVGVEVVSVRPRMVTAGKNAQWFVGKTAGGIRLRGPQSGEVRIYNVMGRLAYRFNYEGGTDAAVKNLRIPSGNYLVVIKDRSTGRDVHRARMSFAD